MIDSRKKEKIIDNKLYKKIELLCNFNLYKKVQAIYLYIFVFLLLASIFYLIFCIYTNNYYIYIICFIGVLILFLISIAINFFVFLKKINNSISKNIYELYEIYFNKKSIKKLKFKTSEKYNQKRGVDPIKGINQYYYEQVIKYLDTIN